jgi:SAM-dependent methyltransferase
MMETTSREGLYDRDYARKYRDRDNELQALPTNRQLIDWLGSVCDRFGRPIDVLDLGCGTGRYFWGLRHPASIVGLDASAAMLEEARHPVHEDRLPGVPITLVNGNVAAHDFAPGQFDLVYSIGVLAEHVRLDAAIVTRVHAWLRPGGRFAFTTVHPLSPSVARPPLRRLSERLLPLLPAWSTTALHRRLVSGGMYGDERWVEDVMTGRFEIESLERFRSDVHLHGLCVARKAAA